MTTHIGLDYTAAIRQSAGIGRYTREMVKALAMLSAKATEPRLHLFVANSHQQALPPVPGDTCTWHPTQLSERWLTRLWYRLRLPLPIELWTGSLDLYHAPDFFLPPVRAGTRTVVTIHDLSFVREPASVMPGMLNHLTTWVPRSVAAADHVIADSEATRQDLIEFYHTPPEKVSVLYLGVTAEFKPITATDQRSAIRQKYGLGEQPFILSVGTIQPRKNYQRLIQAFAQLESHFDLVIVGGYGWHYQAILAQVTQLGLEKRVHFLGFVADDDLPTLYSTANLFIYPSLYEGFGLPILEAMACGTPVVASNQSALPEVVGQAGLLIEPQSVEAITAAMMRVLHNADLRQKLIQAGLTRAAQFTWTDMAANLLALYQKILDNK